MARPGSRAWPRRRARPEQRRPENQQARLAADYAAGGLAYAQGNLAEARRLLGEVLRHSGTLGLATGTGVHFVRQASASGTRLDDWIVAVAYLDSRHEAAALLDAELRRNPADAAVRLARAFVRHLDGEHQAALDEASALYKTAPSPHVAELAGEEEQHLAHYEKALGWYRLAISTSTGDPGPVAAQAAQLAARELGRKDLAAAILADACAKGNQIPCREKDRFETFRKNGVRPVFAARRSSAQRFDPAAAAHRRANMGRWRRSRILTAPIVRYCCRIRTSPSLKPTCSGWRVTELEVERALAPSAATTRRRWSRHKADEHFGTACQFSTARWLARSTRPARDLPGSGTALRYYDFLSFERSIQEDETFVAKAYNP